jgi:(S)-ureidoglycine aminohydrolase
MGSTDYTAFEPIVLGQCRAALRPGMCAILPRVFREMSFIPGLKDTDAQFLATEELGADFNMTELNIKPGGGTSRTISSQELQTFLYVLEGSLELTFDGRRCEMEPGGYAWLPPGAPYDLNNLTDGLSRVIWFRRRYHRVDDFQLPEPLVRNEKQVPGVPEGTCTAQYLLPFEQNRGFDCAFNLLSFGPSVCFDRAEAHIFEHGAYFLTGRGLFWINGVYHDVRVDDFVYFAPYVPHFVCCQGDEPLKYLLYKNINRDAIRDR